MVHFDSPTIEFDITGKYVTEEELSESVKRKFGIRWMLDRVEYRSQQTVGGERRSKCIAIFVLI